MNAFQTILSKHVKRPLEYDYILLYVFLHFLFTLVKHFLRILGSDLSDDSIES